MATGAYTHGAALAAQGERGHTTAHERSSLSSRAEAIGRELARYGLAVVGLMSVRGFSAVLGVVEVAIALLIAARPFWPRASALGSALAVGMFLTTLSFLVTTPGVWEPSDGGFPALSGFPGSSSSRT